MWLSSGYIRPYAARTLGQPWRKYPTCTPRLHRFPLHKSQSLLLYISLCRCNLTATVHTLEFLGLFKVARVHACMRACMCACVHVCMRAYTDTRDKTHMAGFFWSGSTNCQRVEPSRCELSRQRQRAATNSANRKSRGPGIVSHPVAPHCCKNSTCTAKFNYENARDRSHNTGKYAFCPRTLHFSFVEDNVEETGDSLLQDKLAKSIISSRFYVIWYFLIDCKQA